MKFSTVFVAAAALLCASVTATAPSDAGEVKGVPLVFEAPGSLRQTTFVKGEAVIHSRSEDLATSKIAVPDATNPYVKSKDVGLVGVAFSVTKESDSTEATSSAWAAPLAVGGCAIAAVGIAGFVFMKKRKQQQQQTEDADDEAQTPATGSPSNEVVDFKNDMETPV